MALAGFNSLLFGVQLGSQWNLPNWVESISQVLATPLLILIVGGVIYSFLNAWNLQKNEERLESRAKEEAANFGRDLDKE